MGEFYSLQLILLVQFNNLGLNLGFLNEESLNLDYIKFIFK